MAALLAPAVGFIAVLFLYPFIYGLFLSLTKESGAFTLDNYRRFFTDPWDSRTIWITLKLALPVTLVCVGLAVPFAYYMRRGIRGEKIITFFLILPITLGTVLVSQGMLSFMGPNGWLNLFLMAVLKTLHRLLMALRIVSEPFAGKPFQFTHNELGVMISVGLQGFPYAFLMLLGYISGINPDLEKASQMLGANKWQTFWKVLFPLMVPGIAIAFCLNFVAAFSVYPSAVLLGQPSGRTRVIAIAAYHWAFEKFDFNAATAISMTMAGIELGVIAIVLAWRGRMYKGASIVGKG
jgi:putative spermidine/putrescine transport system permease protein